MTTLIVSHEADQDLRDIVHYVGGEMDNIDAASRIIDSIRNTLVLLPKFPRLGKLCQDFERAIPPVRCFTVEGYTVYYRIREDVVEVGRIIHGRRDRQRILAQMPEFTH